MRLYSLATAVLLFSATVAGHADSFDFSFGNAASLFSGSGVLTTGSLIAPGEYLLKSVTGTAKTSSSGANLIIASILAPGTFPTPKNGGTFPANDNTMFVTNGIGSLDGNGLSFILNNGAQINLYNPTDSAYDALLERASGAVVSEDVPITITATAATPELPGITLLTTGLLSVAGFVRRDIRRLRKH